MNETYNKETMDAKLELIHEVVKDIRGEVVAVKVQTTMHNGRMKKIERNLLIIGCVTGTVLLLKFPEVIETLLKFI